MKVRIGISSKLLFTAALCFLEFGQFGRVYAESIPADESAVIRPCCSTVSTGPSNVMGLYRITKNTYKLDPYLSGSSGEIPSANGIKEGVDFVYEAPKLLGGVNQIPGSIQYQIPAQGTDEGNDDYYDRRLKDLLQPGVGTNLSDIVTEIGSGSQSRVYLLHPKVPTVEQLTALYPDESKLKTRFPDKDVTQARKLAWAIENSKEVVKVRTPTPWERTLNDAAEEARRDIALTDVFDLCAKNFYALEGGEKKRLIEVVPYTNAHHELEQGIFRQPTVNGETAFMIANRVQDAKQGNSAANDYLVNQMKFKSWEDAERKLRLLEMFYAETHYDVIQFEMTNDIPRMGGRPRASTPVMTVGFDFNLGRNVIWDPKAQLFRAIDF